MDLRHSFAVNFLTEGGKLKNLQYIIGHQNVYDTKKLYGEVTGEFVKERSKLIAV